jgi:hypothetical protein
MLSPGWAARMGKWIFFVLAESLQEAKGKKPRLGDSLEA